MSSDGEEDSTAAAMAAMMGFSSFGAQDRPSKKRRFNPRADAAGIHPAPRPAGTGANSTPVGAGAPRHSSNLPLQPRESVAEAANADEIALDDGAGDSHTAAAPQPEPQYIDTSRPVGQDAPVDPLEEAQFQAQIDDIVRAGNEAYSAAALPPPGVPASLPYEQNNFPPPGRAQGTAPAGHHPRSQGGRGAHHHGGGRNSGAGGRDRQWWIDYYDSTSNENPWARLEESLGLQSQGSWLARGERVG